MPVVIIILLKMVNIDHKNRQLLNIFSVSFVYVAKIAQIIFFIIDLRKSIHINVLFQCLIFFFQTRNLT